MWKSIAELVVKYKFIFLALLLAATGFMAYQASKVQLSYEFSKAIPTDNIYYKNQQDFKQKFGDEGNTIVVGVQTNSFFEINHFLAYKKMITSLKALPAVKEMLCIPTSFQLIKDPFTEKLLAELIFSDSIKSQEELDNAKDVFLSLPFYKNTLYNPNTNAYLLAMRIDNTVMASEARTAVVDSILSVTQAYQAATKTEVHTSGLPLIRTLVANRVKAEMKFFLLASILLSIVILLVFFRSFSTMLLSMAVVIIGVIWALGILQLFGYKITLLTALIPSLVVVIGIPNCIYFFNKYHTSIRAGMEKQKAIVEMVSKMGVVTLFCNITAAIGFAVFALTKSEILKEFGAVAGLSIFFIFIISFILLPAVLSLLPLPSKTALKYLDTKWINALIEKMQVWVAYKSKAVLGITAAVLLLAIIGSLRLKNVAFIVDDLPKTDVVYKDLKFFEENFNGVMPLEIMIDTKKPKGIIQPTIDIKTLAFFEDSVISNFPEIGKPLSVVDGVKFSYQALSEGADSSTYALPAFGNPLLDLHRSIRQLQLRKEAGEMDAKDSAMQKLLGSFVDSSEQFLRLSMSMKDVGTVRLKQIVDSLQLQSDEVFGDNYKVSFTGASLTFLEGSKYIVNGLKESILWAFGLIAACMLYLFRNWRILVCSLIPNVIPLLVTAGIMGWAGVAIKPSTVLVFSVALGIAVDVTIRFLVHYKQLLSEGNISNTKAVTETINKTALSIIYTSLVLVAGFVIFCGSSFGGTFALGWLTSVTLLTALFTNLVLLPILLKKILK